ncbi:succinic semialdehyde dehydrogenase [Actinoplanes utahensis]|uniref:Succinate-semialdehyde dehydrogenase n=1 Tax=Actinoplanes utahensis TaxID=1869 RepID=A0A0A6UMI0_ACTUT|nr:succinic semialdehyde dehydrogenase [Actinoplanes utahensis]KHD75529.1 succinate-semialdehyde dehydrogenase [Actinoplanes utahensis]GIF32324.1 succinic semialdehyde dehydrogenase [Actinoplanes utahensis]
MDTGPVSAHRPAWLTGARLASLRRWVAVPASGGKTTHTPIAPYDALPTVAVPVCTPEDVESAAARARTAQEPWAGLSYGARAEVVLRFHDLLVARQDEVLDLIQWETGKARLHAWQEVLLLGTVARHYARHGRSYLADRTVRPAVPLLTRARELRLPKGVVGIIAPWNHPLYLGVGDLIPALLAGNAVLGKADGQTPLTLLWARALMAEAGLPENVWQVVTGDGPTIGSAVVDAVDHLCFTGSTATGRAVAERAARRLIGVSLELGGKNPLIVRADADPDLAARGTVEAAFANSGQMCVHIERVIVDAAVYDAFTAALLAATSGQRLGQGLGYGYDIGPLATRAQLEKVGAHVTDAVAKGATVLAGGRARPDIGPYAYQPTVLADVTDDMDLCLGETFGPVLALHRVSGDAAAIAAANRGRHGLSAAVFSRDTAAAEAMARRIRAGAVNVNDGAGLAIGTVEAPMGGRGDSGLGRRHGPEGIRRFTDAQTVAVSRLGPIGPPPGRPAESFVNLGNRQLRLLRRLGIR